MQVLTYFSDLKGEDLPERMPSPFATVPHGLARRAARVLQEELRRGEHDLLGQPFDQPRGGKMLGVLVVRDADCRLAFVRGASGMLGGNWRPQGFVAPLFDDVEREGFWPAGQAALDRISTQLRELQSGACASLLREEQARLLQAQEAATGELRLMHRENKAARAKLRAGRAPLDLATERQLRHGSQADRRARRQMRSEHLHEGALWQQRKDKFEAQLKELRVARSTLSTQLLRRIQKGYEIRNAAGETCSLASLYPGDAPGGSADCAAPKLLGYAYKHGLKPIALAEFWWGAPPPGGGRRSGQFYPACRGKCGPLLPFMMQGLAHEPAPLFASENIPEADLRVLFEDDFLLVVDKPAGLLSVPGASPAHRDSVLSRLRDARAEHEKPYQVHRLDLDTSGVLLLAKTREAHRAMQEQFAERLVDKRYVAWVDGPVHRDRGRIELSLRVDLDDRPRQVVDAEHGKPSTTDYLVLERVVLERAHKVTKVAFFPLTGRTHQIRVHAAHPLGLDAPIAGDRLYGRPSSRLYLHAESLAFVHPFSGEEICIQSPLPAAFQTPPPGR